jgi:hypothetical protein
MEDIVARLLFQVELSKKYQPRIRKEKRIAMIRETLTQTFMRGFEEGFKECNKVKQAPQGLPVIRASRC